MKTTSTVCVCLYVLYLFSSALSLCCSLLITDYWPFTPVGDIISGLPRGGGRGGSLVSVHGQSTNQCPPWPRPPLHSWSAVCCDTNIHQLWMQVDIHQQWSFCAVATGLSRPLGCKEGVCTSCVWHIDLSSEYLMRTLRARFHYRFCHMLTFKVDRKESLRKNRQFWQSQDIFGDEDILGKCRKMGKPCTFNLQ